MAIVRNSLPQFNKNIKFSNFRLVSVDFPVSVISSILPTRDYSNQKENYLKYYSVLKIENNSDQEQVRTAFLNLVKRYHPDSGSPEANEEEFHQIETAYRKLQEKFASERWNVNDGAGEYGLYYKEQKVKEFDIQHTAPQHRQYLSYDGYGYGTPQQRQKQYQKLRAYTAAQNVFNHRIEKLKHSEEQALILKDTREAKKIKIRSEMDRLVEDLIQESMSRGDFNNLAGSGKPLKSRDTNPYVDFVTQKMNQMLIDNGFTPSWITLQKEVIHDLRELRSKLAKERMHFGPPPLVGDEAMTWTEVVEAHAEKVKQINKNISNFNLQVPLLNKQMVLVSLQREANNILQKGKTKLDAGSSIEKAAEKESQSPNSSNIFTLFETILGKL